MSNKNCYEVLDQFRNAKTKKERIEVLQNNNVHHFREVLRGVFDDRIKFAIKKIPPYNIVEIPPGMAYSHMNEALRKIYLFMENNPRTPAGLTDKRREELLIQILETLEPREAEVFICLLKKDLKVPFLTEALVKEAIPDVLP